MWNNIQNLISGVFWLLSWRGGGMILSCSPTFKVRGLKLGLGTFFILDIVAYGGGGINPQDTPVNMPLINIPS